MLIIEEWSFVSKIQLISLDCYYERERKNIRALLILSPYAFAILTQSFDFSVKARGEK